jgi:hypothetical protein
MGYGCFKNHDSQNTVKEMDFGTMIGESFEYAKDAVFGNYKKWLMLVAATILLGIPLFGYLMKVLRGENPSPEVKDWRTLFADGIKYLAITLIYAIPLIIAGILIAREVVAGMTGGTLADMMTAFVLIIVGLVIMIIIAIFIAFFEIIGIVRFARTGSVREAFNVIEILAMIKKLGFGRYLIAFDILIISGFIMEIIGNVLMIIPVIGGFICLFLIPPFTLFIARFISLLYDSANRG